MYRVRFFEDLANETRSERLTVTSNKPYAKPHAKPSTRARAKLDVALLAR